MYMSLVALFHLGKFHVSLFIILLLGDSWRDLEEKNDMSIRITNTYSIYKSIKHFYLNRGKADNGDNNNNVNGTMIGSP